LRPHCLAGPGCQPLSVLDDIDRHFVVTLQRLPGAGPERFHPHLKIRLPARGVRFEVKPPFGDNGKKDLIAVKAPVAEHVPAFQIPEIAHLFQNKILKGAGLHAN
jgi:hypothetical protein